MRIRVRAIRRAGELLQQVNGQGARTDHLSEGDRTKLTQARPHMTPVTAVPMTNYLINETTPRAIPTTPRKRDQAAIRAGALIAGSGLLKYHWTTPAAPAGSTRNSTLCPFDSPSAQRTS